MPSHSKLRQIAYALLTLVGFVWTQYHLVHFVEDSAGSFTLANLLAFDWERFLADAQINPAASFVMVDVTIGIWALVIFCLAESKRIGLKFGWVCIPVAFLVAYAVACPLFLFMRERHLDRPGHSE